MSIDLGRAERLQPRPEVVRVVALALQVALRLVRQALEQDLRQRDRHVDRDLGLRCCPRSNTRTRSMRGGATGPAAALDGAGC